MTHIVEIEGMPISAAGRVALCHAAITTAMKSGFSKKEIARQLGLSYMTFFRAWKAQKFDVPAERQLPLPVAPDKECFRAVHSSSSDNGGGGEHKQKPVSKSGILESAATKPSNQIDLDDPANQE